MNIKHLIVSVTIAAAGAFASGVIADQAAFTKLDANSDSYISMEEADKDAMLKENWDNVDINKDGMVEQAEFSAFEEKMPEPAK